MKQAVRAKLPANEPRCRTCGIELFDPITGTPRYLDGCGSCTTRRPKHKTRRFDYETTLYALGLLPSRVR